MATISEIKAANKAAGFHFFDRSSMRFFNSRIERGVYEGPGGIYFVTSEQFIPSDGRPDPRKFTVRTFDPATGNVDTAGEFNELRTLESARTQARKLAKGGA